MNRSLSISFYLPLRIFPEVLKYDYFLSGNIETILQERYSPSIRFML